MRVRRLDENHDWTFGKGRNNYAQESEAIRQCVMTRLLSLYGDWFQNPDAGVRWFDYLAKNPSLRSLEVELKGVVLNTEGVAELVEFALSLNSDTRKLTVSLDYIDIYDSTQGVTVDAPDY